MPIHYEIETDALFLEGKEQGIEQGVEQGVEKTKYDTIIRMLRLSQFTKEVIALVVGVDIDFVLQVERELQKNTKK